MLSGRGSSRESSGGTGWRVPLDGCLDERGWLGSHC